MVRCADRVAEAILCPDEENVLIADALVRRWFPNRPMSRVLSGVLAAAAEDADLYPGIAAPDAFVTTVAWAKHLSYPELVLAAAARPTPQPTAVRPRAVTVA